MRTPEVLIEDLRNMEKEVAELIATLETLDKQEMDAEPDHRQMISEIMNMDSIAKLPNQTMRDDALENYVLNHIDYADKHRAYLLLKLKGKNTYRKYRYLEECMKNRRAELQTITYGGTQ
jgi:hypothetical protein